MFSRQPVIKTTHAHVRIHTRVCMHTCTHGSTHSRAHVHTHTHTLSLSLSLSLSLTHTHTHIYTYSSSHTPLIESEGFPQLSLQKSAGNIMLSLSSSYARDERDVYSTAIIDPILASELLYTCLQTTQKLLFSFLC